MKSVLLSIRPEWCQFIESGVITIEIRKSRPNIEPLFKCYIYETLGEKIKLSNFVKGTVYRGCGKVIGEFVCDEIDMYTTAFWDEQEESDTYDIARLIYYSRLKYKDFRSYVGEKDFYAWHISDLVIYDKPKDLSDFYVEGDCDCMNCRKCAWFDKGNGYNIEDDCNLAYKGVAEHKSYKPIKRPPQSWCYVEELR